MGNPNILIPEYVYEYGTFFDENIFVYETYSANGKNYYEQLFDKPRREGGKPFNGLLYETYADGSLREYHYYRNGFEYGDNVTFYKNGQASRYTCFDKGGFVGKAYEWYENGCIKCIYERHRKDNPIFFRKTKYDVNGNITMMSVHCEVNFSYDFSNINNNYIVLWHSNGEFRTIIWKNPSREELYKSVEFDDGGYLLRFEINRSYNPKYLSIIGNKVNYKIKMFDVHFRFSDDILLSNLNSDLFCPFTGKVCFMYTSGEIWKIFEYKNGIQFSTQFIFHKNGQIAEKYDVENGVLFNKHFKWYDDGKLKEVICYSKDGFKKWSKKWK